MTALKNDGVPGSHPTGAVSYTGDFNTGCEKSANNPIASAAARKHHSRSPTFEPSEIPQR
jgi:hypothetical protein